MSATPPNNPQAPAKNGTRKRGLTIIAAVVIVAGLAYAGYEWIVGSRYESTDNAYVQANVVQITPLVGGTVRAVYADDTDFVKAGQKLVSLDPVDARVALEQAQAQLAQTVREVRTLYANNSGFEAQVKVREADLKRVTVDLDRLQSDVARRQPLVAMPACTRRTSSASSSATSLLKRWLMRWTARIAGLGSPAR